MDSDTCQITMHLVCGYRVVSMQYICNRQVNKDQKYVVLKSKEELLQQSKQHRLQQMRSVRVMSPG